MFDDIGTINATGRQLVGRHRHLGSRERCVNTRRDLVAGSTPQHRTKFALSSRYWRHVFEPTLDVCGVMTLVAKLPERSLEAWFVTNAFGDHRSKLGPFTARLKFIADLIKDSCGEDELPPRDNNVKVLGVFDRVRRPAEERRLELTLERVSNLVRQKFIWILDVTNAHPPCQALKEAGSKERLFATHPQLPSLT